MKLLFKILPFILIIGVIVAIKYFTAPDCARCGENAMGGYRIQGSSDMICKKCHHFYYK